MTVNELNESFGIEGHLQFQTGEGDLPKAVIRNEFASAEVYLQGAHVTAFQPHDSDPVLWLSDIAQFQQGKALRGGIPIAWPWFGPHRTDKSKPQHGFARVSDWTPVSTTALPDGRTQLRLQLTDSEATRDLWPSSFQLELGVTVGKQLRVDLTSRNTGKDIIEIGGALHTYFRVGDIDQVTIEGLDGREYLDQLEDHKRKLQTGPLRIAGEVDRIYVNTNDEGVIVDPAMGRRIRVAKEGSRTTVVWNPWVAKAQQMSDFPNDGYRTMVCIETTNAADDLYRVAPGGEHTLTQSISVE